MSKQFNEIKAELKQLIINDFNNYVKQNFMPFLGINKIPYGFVKLEKDKYDLNTELIKIENYIENATSYAQFKNLNIMTYLGDLYDDYIFVVDYDKLKEDKKTSKCCGIEFFNNNILNNDALKTYTIQTKSGGFHQYYKIDKLKNEDIYNNLYNLDLGALKCEGDILHKTRKIVLSAYDCEDKKIIKNIYKKFINIDIKYIDNVVYNELMNVVINKKEIKNIKNKNEIKCCDDDVEMFYYIDKKTEETIFNIIKMLIELFGKNITKQQYYNKILYIIRSMERKNENKQYFYIIDYYCKETGEKLKYHSFYDKEKLLKTYMSININNIKSKLTFFKFILQDYENKNELYKSIEKMISTLPEYKTQKYNFFTNNIYGDDYKKSNDETILSKNEDKKQEQTKKFMDYDNIIIKSQTGTGKTFFVSHLFKKLKEENNKLKFISLTSRRSLAYTHFTAFKKDDIDVNLYLDGLFEDNLVIQLETLGKFKDINMDYYTKDTILIIDEYNSNLEHLLTSDTFKKLGSRYYIFNKYIQLIQNCEKIILLDADITDYSLKFINKYRNFDKYKTIIYENTHKCCLNKEINLYSDELLLHNKFIDKILKMVDDGNYDENNNFIDFKEGVCMISDTQSKFKAYKDNLIEIVKFYKNVDISNHINFYTANEGDKEDLKDVSIKWSNKINMYNQSILYGIDYQHLNKEDTFIWCSGGAMRNNATSIAQSMNRNRNINMVHCYLPNQSNEIRYDDLDDVKKDLVECEELCELIKEYIYEKKNVFVPLILDDNIETEEDKEDRKKMKFINKIYSEILYKNEIINSNIKFHFINECKKKGMIINDINLLGDKDYYGDYFKDKTMGQVLNNIQNENRQEHNEMIKNILEKYIDTQHTEYMFDDENQKDIFYKNIKEDLKNVFEINEVNGIISILHRLKFHEKPKEKYNDFFNMISNKYEYYNTFNAMYLLVNEASLDEYLLDKIDNNSIHREHYNKIINTNKSKILTIKRLLNNINSNIYSIDNKTLNEIINYDGDEKEEEIINNDKILKDCNDLIPLIKKQFNNRNLKDFKDLSDVKTFCITQIKKICPSLIASKVSKKKYTHYFNKDKLLSIINMCLLIGSKFEIKKFSDDKQKCYNNYIIKKIRLYKNI